MTMAFLHNNRHTLSITHLTPILLERYQRGMIIFQGGTKGFELLAKGVKLLPKALQFLTAILFRRLVTRRRQAIGGASSRHGATTARAMFTGKEAAVFGVVGIWRRLCDGNDFYRRNTSGSFTNGRSVRIKTSTVFNDSDIHFSFRSANTDGSQEECFGMHVH